MGVIVLFDVSDVCGMNFWDIFKQEYNEIFFCFVVGGDFVDFCKKFGEVCMDGGGFMGVVFLYFVFKYGFSVDCQIVFFIGDNFVMIFVLLLRFFDVIVLFGIFIIFFMNIFKYCFDGVYYFFNYFIIVGYYMFMLCYKNGGFVCEKVCDQFFKFEGGVIGWENFNDVVLNIKLFGIEKEGDCVKMGLYFYFCEIVLNICVGIWCYFSNVDGLDLCEE